MDRLFGLDKPRRADEGMALLTTTHDNIELSILESILEGEKIPYITYDRGAGGAMRIIAGYSVMGTDIFVPEELLEHLRHSRRLRVAAHHHSAAVIVFRRRGDHDVDALAERLLEEEHAYRPAGGAARVPHARPLYESRGLLPEKRLAKIVGPPSV